MPFTRGNTPPTMKPSAAILAADAWVLAHGVSEDGAIRLMAGMWKQIRTELDAGNRVTRHWLDSAAFGVWADAAKADPAALRDHLIAAHWECRAA